jgi:hypothetical protein
MTIETYNGLVNRIAGNYHKKVPLWGRRSATTTAAISGTNSGTMQRCGDCIAFPTLPSGVTGYVITNVVLTNSTTNNTGLLLAKVVNLGTFDIGNTNVGTFTDGSAMPTQEVLGTSSASLCSSVLVEVTTATAGTQTLTTVTYKNQAGTGGQTTTFTPVTSAVAGSTSFLLLTTLTDWGVQDITAVARSSSAGPTGVLKFWGLVPICFVPSTLAAVPIPVNLISDQFNMNILGAADVVNLFVLGSTAARATWGQVYSVGMD